jgi:hypothetical protein
MCRREQIGITAGSPVQVRSSNCMHVVQRLLRKDAITLPPVSVARDKKKDATHHENFQNPDTRIVQRKQCLNRTSVHPVCYIPTDPVVEPPRPGKTNGTSNLGQSSRASSSTNQLQPSKTENHPIFPLFKSEVSSAWRVVLAAGSGFWNKAPQINSNVDLLFLVELVSLW